MRYAFMSFSTTQLNLADTLALAKHLGYDAIEPARAGTTVTVSNFQLRSTNAPACAA
ncbi:MAG: hypothetical protein WC661_11710 [Opitutaceae bacterium]|jgi:hypothetical protein